MTPIELRQRYGQMLSAHDEKLKELEVEEQRLGGELRRGLAQLLREAGQQVSVSAGLEETEAFLNAFPPVKTDLPRELRDEELEAHGFQYGD